MDKIPFLHPTGKIIAVKIRLPCIYLIDIETRQIE